MADKESRHDTGRRVGSVAMSALMVWSMAPHPVIAQTVSGTAEDGDAQTPQEALEKNAAQQEAEAITAENDGSDAAADEAAAEETQEALGEKLDAASGAAAASGNSAASGAAAASGNSAAALDATAPAADKAADAKAAAAPAAAAAATTAANVAYVDASGALKQAPTATLLSSALASSATLPAGWYLVDTDITQANRIVTSGNVNLILGDGHTLNAQAGIECMGSNSLTIYCQTAQTGTLNAQASNASAQAAAIGATNTGACGTVTINGGVVNANNGSATRGPGIGGCGANGGSVTINGGAVTATGSTLAQDGNVQYFPGIGSSSSGRLTSITINGGTVNASASSRGGGAGIGESSLVSITGGNVTASGPADGNAVHSPGIGITCADGGQIKISGGTVTAAGGVYSPAMGASGAHGWGTIEITGGNVSATAGAGGDYSAPSAIGGACEGTGGSITISGASTTVYASVPDRGQWSAAIGGGARSKAGTIAISNGAHVTTKSCVEGIGTGVSGDSTGSITIDSAYVRVISIGDVTESGIGACGNASTVPVSAQTPVAILGNAVVISDGPICQTSQSSWRGLVGQGRAADGSLSKNNGVKTAALYGTTVNPAFSFEIPAGFTLNIDANKTLGVHNGVSMNNLGTVSVSGTLDYTGGHLYNSGTITKVGSGQIIPSGTVTTVTPATIAMAAQTGSPVYGDTVSLQATVTNANGNNGTVKFFVNGTLAGTATPNASGVATLSSQAVEPLWHGGSNSVYAVFSGGTDQADAKSSTITYSVAKKPLAVPANVAWTVGSGNATVSWNAVDHAKYYTVQLVKDGQAQGLPLYVYSTTGATSVNWTFPITAAGSYTAQVTAVGDTNYANAQATTAVAVNTVSFNAGVAGSGASGMPSLQGVLASGTYTKPGDPTATGYVFSHWTAPDGSNPFASGSTTTVASPLLLTANWGLTAMTGVRWSGSAQAAWNAVPNAHDYLVTLYKNNGSTSVAVGTANNVLPPTTTFGFANMTAPGTYSFSVQALGDTGVVSNAPVTSGLASSVQFDTAGATSANIPIRFVSHGSTVGAVTQPTRDGCTFLGWTASGLSTPTMDISNQVVSGPATYTAQWQMNNVQSATWGAVATGGTSATATWTPTGSGVSGYKVQLYKSVNGAAATAVGREIQVSGDTTSSVSVPITPEEGAVYTFSVKAFGDHASANNATQSNELNTVTFIPENGGTTSYQLVADGNKATQPTAPTWSTNVFRGWRTAPNASNYAFTTTAVNDPVTLHGMWKQGQVPQNVQVASPNRVTWDAVPGATEYMVQVCGATNGPSFPAAVPLVSTTTTSCDLVPTGVQNAEARMVRVQARSNNPWFETLGTTGPNTYGHVAACLVVFNANGGSLDSGAAKGAVVAPNMAVGSTLTDAKRTNYNFTGWKNGSTTVDATTPVTANCTYTAQWQLAAQPTNLAWSTSNPQAPTLSWTAAPGATGYTVTLLRNGTAVSGTPTVNGTTASFAGMMDQPGTYTVQVQAHGDQVAPSAAVTSPAIHSAQFVSGTAGGAATGMPALSFAVKGGSMAKPADPTATGYVFAGWRDTAGNDPFAQGAYTMGDAPVTFTAAWNLTAPTGLGWGTNHTTATWNTVDHATSYEVTLTGPNNKTTTFTVNQPTSGSTASVDMGGSMTQAGTYSFSVQAIGDSTVGNSVSSTVAQPVHTVTYNCDGGTSVDMGYVVNNTAVAPLPSTTRTGYTFVNWMDGSTVYTNAPVTAPITLTATWKANTYQVTFDANGGDAVSPVSFTYDQGLTSLPNATRAGADFAGWYDAQGNKVTSIPANSQDVALTAHWTMNAPAWDASNPGTATWTEVPGAGSYTVTLMKQDASGNWAAVPGAEQTVAAGGGKTASAAFAGQITAAGAGTYAVTVSAAGVSGVGAAATSAESNNLYTVSVDENHGTQGTGTVKQLVVDGSTVNVSGLGTPTWDSNAFKGWTETLVDRQLGTPYDGTAAVHAPVTLHAQWQLAAPTFDASASNVWTVSTTTATSADAAWNAVTGAFGYSVQLMNGAAASGSAQSTAAGTTSARFTGLSGAGATYTAAVTATGGLGILDSVAATSPALYTVAWASGTTDAVTNMPSSPLLAPAGSTVSRPTTDPVRPGYTFGGWQAGGASVLAPNQPYTVNAPVTFTAVWDLSAVTGVAWGANNTSATFDPVAGAETYTVHVTGSDGASSSDITVDASKVTVTGGKVVVDLSSAMANPGTYTFSVEAAATGMQSAAATAVGTSVHSVSFVMNDATSAAEPMRFVADGGTVGAVAEPTRSGASFDGWTGGALAGATKDISAQKVTAPVTYTATWTMDAPANLGWSNASSTGATASWGAVDGATGYVVTVFHDGTAVLTDAPATGTTLAYTVPANETGTWTFSVVAKGSNAADSQAAALPAGNALCSVTFDGNGATAGVPDRQLVVSGGHATQPANPTRTGYSFSRWALTSSPNAAYDFANTAVTGAITLQAQWTQDVYNITYQTNGGTNPAGAATTYTYDQGVTLPTPTRDGYTFDGWCLQKDLSDTPIKSIAAATTTGDKTFYAKWSVNTYTVTFDGNAPTGSTTDPVSPESFSFDTGLAKLPDAQNNDYKFAGWNTKSDGTGTTLTSIAPNSQPGNVTLYAQWQLKTPAAPTVTGENAVEWAAVPGAGSYSVKVLDANGAVAPTSEVTATVSGTTATLVPTAAASGKSYTVAVRATGATTGSNVADSTWSAASAQLHAVTFDAAGGMLAKPADAVVLVGDGQQVASNGMPTLSGRSFTGWFATGSSAAETFPATVKAPVTYTAQWQWNTPANPVWTGTTESHTTAQWAVVPGATSYEVTLLDASGNAVGQPQTVAPTAGASLVSCDFSSAISGAGTWTFSVTASGAGAATSSAATSADLYSVQFDANGGTLGTNASEYVYATSGQKLAQPADPSRSGCDFAGWKLTSATGTDVSWPYAVSGAATLVAAWNVSAPVNLAWDTAAPGTATFDVVPGADSYTVTLIKDGKPTSVTKQVAQPAAGATSVSADFAAQIAAQGAGTYGFAVEATGAAGTGTASATLDAAAPKLVTVSYNANVPAGQTVTGMPAMQLCVTGATNVAKPSDPAWASNAFAGWKSSPTAANAYTFGQPVDAPVELFATWTLDKVDASTMAWDLSNQSAPELSFDAVTGASGYTVTLHSLGTGASTATTAVVDAAKVTEANGTVTVDLGGLMADKGTYWVTVTPTSAQPGVAAGAEAQSTRVYTVSFLSANDVTGAAPAMQLVEANGTATDPGAGAMTRADATFAEWRVSGQASAYSFATPVTAPVELQSTWRLQAPTGLDWTVGGNTTTGDKAMPKWANVTGATSYTVSLYDANDLTKPVKTQTETDGTSTLPLDIPAGSGAYVFTVTAESTDPTLLSSAPSANSVKLFTVNFDLNGGTGSQTGRQLVKDGDATVVKPSSAPTRTGAVFGHWTSGNAVSGPAFGFVSDAVPTTVTAPVTLTATWTMTAPAAGSLAWTAPAGNLSATTATWANVTGNGGYTVTLTKPDNTTVQRDVAADGTSCDFSADITGAGTWTFSVVTKGTGATPSAPVTSGKLVSAHFDANGAGLLNTPALNGSAYVYVPEAGSLAEPANQPTCDGYIFGGWQVAGTAVTFPYTMGSAPVDLTAQWRPAVYSITYNLDGGTNPTSAPATYTFGVEETLPTPTKTGYDFGGWYTNAQLTGNPVTSVASGTLGNQVFYAKWTASSYKLTWDVNAPVGAAASMDKAPAASYTFGQGVAEVDFPQASCTGYVFDGWYDASGTKVTEISATSTGDVALTARWSVAAPTNLAWNATAANSAVATWTAPVAGCTYNVNLYKVAPGGTLVPVATKAAVSGTSCDFSAEIRSASNKDAGAGSYVFDVTATTATTCADGSAIGDSALARLDQATTPKLVTVSFDPEGGTDVPLGLVVAGHTLGTAPVSTKADASLDGWYEAGSATAFDFANTSVTAPLDLAARWTLAAPADPAWSSTDAATATWKPVTGATGYSVQLYKEGQPQGQPVTVGAADTSAKLPVSGEGTFTFTVTAAGAGATAGSAASVKSAALYSVSYNGNGASVTGVPATAYVRAGESATEPQSVANGSSTLVGWFDATGAQHNFGTPVTAPLSLTAHWQLAKAAAPTWELTGVSTATAQKVTWVPVDNATGYEVTLANANGASQTKTVTGATECTFDIAAGGPYTVTVQATGGAGYTAGAVSDASGALVTLAFDADGGTPAPAMEVMPAGTVPTKPAEPSREHYTFGGWREGGAAATGDFDFAAPLHTSATVTAVWQLVPSKGADWNPGTPGQAVWAPVASATGYTVTLYCNNTKVDTYNATQSETSHTFSITAPGAYTFQVAATGTGIASPVTPSDHTLYTVSFDTNGANAGSPAPAMQLVVAGQHAQAPVAAQLPVRDGASLVGWSAAGATGATYDFSGTPVNAVTTLTAVWQLDEPANLAWTATADGGTASWDAVPGATGYNVEVKDASGAVVQTFSGVSGTSQAVKLADAGAYTFTVVAVGNGAGAAHPALASRPAASDAVDEGTLYSVTYHGEGGTLAGADRVFVSGGQAVADPGNPSWAGHGFTGWRSGSTTGPAYSFGQKPTAPVDLYATWKMDAPASAQWSDADPGTATWDANPAASRYTVTLTDANGTLVATHNVAATTTSSDFADDITAPGTYSFSVVATGNGAADSDATVSGTIHTVTYHAAAGATGVPAMALVKDGQAATVPAAPSLGGASFVAWAEGSVTGTPYNFAGAVSAPVELWATWKLDAPAAPVWEASAVAGTVSWQPVENALGYSVQLLDSTGAPVGAAVKTATASAVLPVSAAGTYTFKVVATGAQGFSESDAAVSGTAHTVTFDGNGGTGAPAMRTVADGAVIGAAAEPTRTGMAFDGWVDAAGAAVDPATATVGSPVALTATFKLATPEGVTWDLAGGASVATWQPVVGATGYEVVVTDASGAQSTHQATGTSLDLKLSAPGSYTYAVTAVGTGVVSSSPATSATIHSVTYDYNDGATPSATRFVVDGAHAEDLAVPDRSADGWAFDGWRQGSASGAAWNFSDGVKAPVALVSAWKGIEYQVVLDTDGGAVNAGNVTGYTHGQATALPTDVTHDGCTFAGWYTTADFESPDFYNPGFAGKPVIEISASSVGDVTYHAKWVPNTYTLSLNPEGGVILDRWSTHYTYGSGFNLPMNVYKPGFTFEGWFTAPDGGVEKDAIGDREFGDVQLYAHWKANDYTLTLNANGGTLPEGSPDGYVHGKGVRLPQPTRDGYTFDGWYDNAGLTGAPVSEVAADAMGDKAFWAKWSSHASEVTSVKLNGVSGTVEGTTVTVVLPAGSELPQDPLLFLIGLPAGAVASTPVTTDGGHTWRFVVTAEDGSVSEYTVMVSVAEGPTAPTKPQTPTGLPSKGELEAQVREELDRGGRVVPVDGKGHIAKTGDVSQGAGASLLGAALASAAVTFWTLLGRRSKDEEDEAGSDTGVTGK
ncbi:InlB B-repeat-containing protein [Atopobiaceae bacterium 24-176]